MNDDEMYEDLIRQFEEMLKTNENYFFDLEEFLDIIDDYITMGNYHMAGKAIEIALSQYENSVDILLYKAELYSLKDQLGKAKQVIAQLKAIDPARIEIPMLEAEFYSRQHMHHEAIKALNEALQLAGSNKAEIYEMLTVEYMYLEDYRSALEAALESLNYDEENTMSLYNAVTCYDLLDESHQAIAFLTKQIKQRPFNEVAWSLLGKKYLDVEQYQKAIEALDYAIAIDDHFLGAYYDKAYAYARMNEFEKAIEFYKLTLDIADPTAFTYYHIAKNYEKLQEFDRAVKHYLLAINEDPAYFKAWIKLIRIKIYQQEYDEALELTKKALEVVNNQDLYELLGEIHLLKKSYLHAIPAFEMSLKLGSLRLPVVLKLVDLYKKIHDVDKRRALLLSAKQEFPDSPEIKKLMLDE